MTEQKRNVKKTARFLAVDILDKTDKQGAYSNVSLNDAVKRNNLSIADTGLLTELVYGVLQRKLTLDYFLSSFIAEDRTIDPWVRNLLRISVYQMVYLDKVPAHAILFEAGEIAKARGHMGISKFVNGVLRNIERKGLSDISAIQDEVLRLSVEASMPEWMVQKFINEIGMTETRKLALSLLHPSRLSARVNRKFTTQAEAIEALAEEGIEAIASAVTPDGIIIEKGNIARSNLFQFGLITIQDESSMLVAPALQLEANHLVLDCCAAPGGKTTHIASYLDAEQGGKVLALDLHQNKMKKIKENAVRLRVEDVVETHALDARKVDEQFEDGLFDRILVDAPCSGLGLMRRKPDIKYTKKAEDMQNLQKIQLEILERVCPKLKLYGIMVYSTCTITSEENTEVVQQFLESHPEYEQIDIAMGDYLSTSLQGKNLQIYPHQYGTDGFFISCLRKVK